VRLEVGVLIARAISPQSLSATCRRAPP
jgi:hypothetical protein